MSHPRPPRGAPRVIRVLVHADEACLRNGMEPPNPGGAGGLVEVRRASSAERRDYFIAEPDTTNNRMALRSAITALELLTAKGRAITVDFVSDSNYLIKGMREWAPAWRRQGWKRKQGGRLVEVANLELWQRLVELADPLTIRWRWVRGHAGHPQNEYANFLATRAARDQKSSGGLVPSGFTQWQQARGLGIGD